MIKTKITKSVALLVICLSIVGCSSSTMFDSRYSKAKDYILTKLNDPDSYKEEYCKFDPKFKDVYKIKFRAKNGFGAMKIQYAYAHFDDKGNLLWVDISDTENSTDDRFVNDQKTTNKYGMEINK